MDAQTKTEEMDRCIKNCLECYQVCEETANHCLMMGGKHTEVVHIRLLLDCATLCNASAKLMIHNSDFHSDECKVCAEICNRCAESCKKIGNDAQMQSCIEICLRCAESCHEMAKAAQLR
jgi:hypothetical protein